MKLSMTIILFVTILISGFILARLGKPYNTGIFTIHKLVALGLVVYFFIHIRQYLSTNGIEGLLIMAIIVSALSIIGLFATGAMMSIGGFKQSLLKTIHLVTLVTVTAGGFVIVMILGLLKNNN